MTGLCLSPGSLLPCPIISVYLLRKTSDAKTLDPNEAILKVAQFPF